MAWIDEYAWLSRDDTKAQQINIWINYNKWISLNGWLLLSWLLTKLFCSNNLDPCDEIDRWLNLQRNMMMLWSWSNKIFCCPVCFVTTDHWFLLFSVMLKRCLKQLYVEPCHVVRADTAVAMAVPIENPADCEARDVIRFLQTDEILGYLAEEANSYMELFCSTTLYVRVLAGRHQSWYVNNSIGTSSSIRRTVRT